MNQSSLFRLLLRPSFLSGSLVILSTFAVLGYTAWLYIAKSQILYTTLIGSYGLQDFISENTGGLVAWQRVLVANPISYYVLVGGVAAAAGMVVFTFLQIIGSLFRNTSSFVHQAMGGKSGRIAFLKESFLRLWLRLLAAIGWVVFAAAFVSMILPFCILLNQTGVESIHDNDYRGIGICIVAFLILLIGMHLHVIFARSLMLRPRVFGGDEEIAAAESR